MPIEFGKFSSDIIKNIKILHTDSHKPTHASAFLVWYSRPTSDIRKAIELGSGTGVVAFALATLYNLYVEGVEIQEQLYELAIQGIQLNHLEGKVHFTCCDVRYIRKFFKPESFDMVVSNFPFHVGKESPDEVRKISRNASLELIEHFINSSAYLLRNKGTFVFVFSPKLLVPVMDLLSKNKLIVQRMCFLHGTPEKKAKLVALRGRKNGGYEVIVDSPQWGG
ncbi:MAG: tRNA1(Val) (adenine(37)-N6)-methyltransferase [Fervidobacterium sp.]